MLGARRMCEYLGYEGDQLSEVLGLLVGIDPKDLAGAVVVGPLLEELFSVGVWVAFDEVLQLGQVGGEQDPASHQRRRGWIWLMS